MLHFVDLAAGQSFAASPGEPIIFYTVPTPRGKQGGVSGDGRLRMVTFAADAGAAGYLFSLVYVTQGGIQVAEFLDWESQTFGGTDLSVSWGTEPGASAFQGAFREGNLNISSRQSADFRWLPAGVEVGIRCRGNAGAVPLQGVVALVEDFGELAQGDEFDVGPPDRLGSTFLVADANE